MKKMDYFIFTYILQSFVYCMWYGWNIDWLERTSFEFQYNIFITRIIFLTHENKSSMRFTLAGNKTVEGQ